MNHRFRECELLWPSGLLVRALTHVNIIVVVSQLRNNYLLQTTTSLGCDVISNPPVKELKVHRIV